MGTLVRYEVQGGIAVLTLNNPPANGYSYELMRDLDEAILAARFDDAVHVLVIRGEGEKVFCAGADIGKLQAMTPTFKYSFCLHANETLLRLENTPKLVIAAIGGHCVGGGLEIALAADIRLARKDGGKIGLPEVSLGVLPGTGGTQRLARLTGKARAVELMITGRLFGFDEAKDLGIVTDVLPGEGFYERVLEYARGFLPPSRASLAVGAIKRAVASGAEVPLESGLALERELQQRLFTSSDAREGLAAFVGKRPPSFAGR
jgi:enoyl-CoA hydratase/carnithine racemase